jgi:hypothetical protein
MVLNVKYLFISEFLSHFIGTSDLNFPRNRKLFFNLFINSCIFLSVCVRVCVLLLLVLCHYLLQFTVIHSCILFTALQSVHS